MEVKYILCNPTGNITALVETKIPVEKHPLVAEMIMEKEPTCEQVGFLLPGEEGSDITLRMAGGEFCGNATMSTAAYYVQRTECEEGSITNVKVKVIGTSGLIDVKIEKKGSEYFGTIEMPKPSSIKDVLFTFENHNYKYPVVNFTGISHVIIEDSIPFYMPERCIKMWCDKLKSLGVGLMLLSEDKKSLRPLVYVKNPETLVWESSCASGTTAVGAYFAKKAGKPVKMELSEPGGTLMVETFEDGKIFLTGKVVLGAGNIDKQGGLR